MGCGVKSCDDGNEGYEDDDGRDKSGDAALDSEGTFLNLNSRVLSQPTSDNSNSHVSS